VTRRCLGVTTDGDRCGRRVTSTARCSTCRAGGGRLEVGLPPVPEYARPDPFGPYVPPHYRRDLFEVPAYLVITDPQGDEVYGTQVPLDATLLVSSWTTEQIELGLRDIGGERLAWVTAVANALRAVGPEQAARIRLLRAWIDDTAVAQEDIGVRLDAERAAIWLLANRDDLSETAVRRLTQLAAFYR
jgi:hypothetical protein